MRCERKVGKEEMKQGNKGEGCCCVFVVYRAFREVGQAHGSNRTPETDQDWRRR